MDNHPKNQCIPDAVAIAEPLASFLKCLFFLQGTVEVLTDSHSSVAPLIPPDQTDRTPEEPVHLQRRQNSHVRKTTRILHCGLSPQKNQCILHRRHNSHVLQKPLAFFLDGLSLPKNQCIPNVVITVALAGPFAFSPKNQCIPNIDMATFFRNHSHSFLTGLSLRRTSAFQRRHYSRVSRTIRILHFRIIARRTNAFPTPTKQPRFSEIIRILLEEPMHLQRRQNSRVRKTIRILDEEPMHLQRPSLQPRFSETIRIPPLMDNPKSPFMETSASSWKLTPHPNPTSTTSLGLLPRETKATPISSHPPSYADSLHK